MQLKSNKQCELCGKPTASNLKIGDLINGVIVKKYVCGECFDRHYSQGE